MLNAMRFILIAALAICAMTGCVAKWDEGQCKNTNWYALGKKYGAVGASFDIDKIQQQCMKDYQIGINRSQYESGYKDGLTRDFCNSRTAYDLGKSGYHYLGVCQRVGKDRLFREAWVKGLKRWCTPSNVKAQGRNGQAFPEWCENVRSVSIASLQNAYDSGRNVYQQKREISSQIAQLDSRIRQIDSQINELERSGYSRNSRKVLELQQMRDHLDKRRQDLKLKKYDNPR